jgi:hypothetical protein
VTLEYLGPKLKWTPKEISGQIKNLKGAATTEKK